MLLTTPGVGALHLRSREIERCRIARGLRFEIARMALGGQLRIAEQPGEHAVGAFMNRLQPALRDMQVVAGFVVDVRPAHALLFQALLPLELSRQKLDAILGLDRLLQRGAIFRTQRLHVGAHHFHLRAGFGHRELERAWDPDETAAHRPRPADCRAR